ncbi:MAG: hypothetical protein SPJ81_02010 [Lachnoclostridium sp.]|nr:hypothetical protein [Lachnoclostridium sp.]
MREKVKFIPPILHIFAVVFGMILLPFVKIGKIRLTIWSILKIGFGKSEGSILEKGVLSIIKSYTQPFVYLILIMIVLLIVMVVLSIVINGKNAYIAGIIGQFVMNGTVIYLFFKLRHNIYAIREMVSFFDLEGVVSFQIFPLIIWILLEILAFMINVCGLYLFRDTNFDREEYIHDIITPGGRNVIPEVVISEEPVSSKPNFPQDSSYYGAIVGKTGMYKEMAFELRKKELVFVVEDGKQILIQREKMSSNMVAQLFYIPEYQEYCIKPLKKLNVFLMSGQPLGNGREYYLPRGTQIYILDKQNLFTLA